MTFPKDDQSIFAEPILEKNPEALKLLTWSDGCSKDAVKIFEKESGKRAAALMAVVGRKPGGAGEPVGILVTAVARMVTPQKQVPGNFQQRSPQGQLA
jgi:hypothetical protein